MAFDFQGDSPKKEVRIHVRQREHRDGSNGGAKEVGESK
jgi:hypothetical protein